MLPLISSFFEERSYEREVNLWDDFDMPNKLVYLGSQVILELTNTCLYWRLEGDIWAPLG